MDQHKKTVRSSTRGLNRAKLSSPVEQAARVSKLKSISLKAGAKEGKRVRSSSGRKDKRRWEVREDTLGKSRSVTEGYKEMGRKGGLSTMDKSGQERAQDERIEIDEPKFKTSA